MFNGRLVKRKWGWYLTILDRKHFKVKLLRFKEGRSLSEQYHKLRGEVWLFLSGSGEFWRGHKDDDYGFWNAKQGDAYWVPIGALHKYICKSSSLILEIQYGEKCLEEDIVRV